MAIKDLTKISTHLFICNGGSCKAKGAEASTAILRATIAGSGYSEPVHTTKTLCNGRCHDGPIVISQPDGIWFRGITPEKAQNFIKQYILEGTVPIENRLYAYGEEFINCTEPE